MFCSSPEEATSYMLRDLQISNLVHFSSAFVYADPSKCLLRNNYLSQSEAAIFPFSLESFQTSENSLALALSGLFAFPMVFPLCQSYSAILAAQMTALKHAKHISQLLATSYQQLCMRARVFASRATLFEQLPRSKRVDFFARSDVSNPSASQSMRPSRTHSRSHSQSRPESITSDVTFRSDAPFSLETPTPSSDVAARSQQQTPSARLTPQLLPQSNDLSPPTCFPLALSHASDQAIREAFNAQSTANSSMFSSVLHDQILEVTRLLSPTQESKHYRFAVFLKKI